MEPGPLRTCVTIAVIGSVLVMWGVMLGFAAWVAGFPGGWSAASGVALGLITAGMCCGVVLIASCGSAPRARPRRRLRTGPSGQARAETACQPGTAEEWIGALRPDAPPRGAEAAAGAPQ